MIKKIHIILFSFFLHSSAAALSPIKRLKQLFVKKDENAQLLKRIDLLIKDFDDFINNPSTKNRQKVIKKLDILIPLIQKKIK